ncbi:MAG TPA: WGxxGxxG family protein [Sphingomicrobium sp.]
MRTRMIVALFLATAVVGPAAAQQPADDNARGGVRTETMSRIASGETGLDLVWNIVGLFGLIGLVGLRGEHADDSYHPASVE